MAWIDFRKAFDIVPHTWITACLEMVRAPEIVRRGLAKVMDKWATNLEIRPEGSEMVQHLLRFRRGLYQGDLLSVLPGGAPLFGLLQTKAGFNLRFHVTPITHVMFMDDVKVYESMQEDLASTLADVELVDVEWVASAVGMTLGVKKCAVAHLNQGRLRCETSGVVVSAGIIRKIGLSTPYRYLGIEQVFRAHNGLMRARVRQEYLERVELVWSSPLNTGEKVAAQYGWAVTVVRFYMPLIEWYRRDLIELDVRTWAVLFVNQAHHPATSSARVHLHRDMGGIGLTALTFVWEVEVMGAALYLVRAADSRIEGAIAFLKHFEEKERKMTILGAALSILDRYGLKCGLLRDANRDAEDDRALGRSLETQAELKAQQWT